MNPPRLNILGVKISAIRLEQAVEIIMGWLAARTPNYVCVTPAHAIMDCQRDPALKAMFNASGLTTPDGMSVVWLLRWNGYPQVNRVYGPDLMKAVCAASLQAGYRHYFYGGKPGVAEKLAANLTSAYPGLAVAGCYSPPFHELSAAEDCQIISQINASGADIVWVGISSPRQEHWMHDHLGKLNAPVMLGVGAAFDFLSGEKSQAPRWMQRSGLEWLFRLFNEPRRLWPRYSQYPRFVLLVLAQIIGLHKYN